MSIILEFMGGHMDGRVLSSESDDPDDVSDALFFYEGTDEGKVGARFECFSDAALTIIQSEGPERARELGFRMNHIYAVTERRCREDVVWVRFCHVPPKRKSPSPSNTKPPKP